MAAEAQAVHLRLPLGVELARIGIAQNREDVGAVWIVARRTVTFLDRAVGEIHQEQRPHGCDRGVFIDFDLSIMAGHANVFGTVVQHGWKSRMVRFMTVHAGAFILHDGMIDGLLSTLAYAVVAIEAQHPTLLL